LATAQSASLADARAMARKAVAKVMEEQLREVCLCMLGGVATLSRYPSKKGWKPSKITPDALPKFRPGNLLPFLAHLSVGP
jgi:hypothetical protein